MTIEQLSVYRTIMKLNRWVCVDKNGTIAFSTCKPIANQKHGLWVADGHGTMTTLHNLNKLTKNWDKLCSLIEVSEIVNAWDKVHVG
jgi:hypothetical protein